MKAIKEFIGKNEFLQVWIVVIENRVRKSISYIVVEKQIITNFWLIHLQKVNSLTTKGQKVFDE